MIRIRSQIIEMGFAALPQVCSILVQLIIIKYYGGSVVNERLPLYTSAMSIVSIFFLGITYTKSRISPSLTAVMITQCVAWGVIIASLYANPRSFIFIFSVCIVTLFNVALSQFHLIRRGSKINYILLSILTSIIAPQILWCNIFIIYIILALLSLLNICLASLNPVKFELAARSTLTQSLYSVFLQAPLLSIGLFDPAIVKIVGTTAYVDYAVFFRICSGAGVFLFSKIQLDIVTAEKYHFNQSLLRNIIAMICVLCFLLCFVNNIISLILQCMLLSLLINIISIFVRTHLLFGQFNLHHVLYCAFGFLFHISICAYLVLQGIQLYTYVPVIVVFLLLASWPAIRAQSQVENVRE
jgi:hypothetical protein